MVVCFVDIDGVADHHCLNRYKYIGPMKQA